MRNTSRGISIVVPVHQMSGRLDKLREWLSKKKESTQVLVVHDNHNHDFATRLELQQICRNTPGSKFIEGKFKNPGSARNEGIKHATREWLLFCDSDDVLNIEKLEQLVTEHEANKKLLVGGYERTSQNSNRKIQASNFFDIFYELGNWRIVYPYSIYSITQFPPLLMAEDYVFFARALSKCEGMIFTNLCLYNYMEDVPNQLTKKPDLRSLRIAHEEMRDLSREGVNKDLIKLLTLRLGITLFRSNSLRNFQLLALDFFANLWPKKNCIYIFKFMILKFRNSQ